MPKKWLILCVILLALVTVTACQPPPPPPPPTPPPPPEPTADELAAKARSALGSLLTDAPMAGDLGVAASFGGTKSQLSATENGRAALGMVQRDVEDAMKKSRDASRWRKVKALCEVYKILQPASDRYVKLERDAELMMARPVVVVTGFVQTGGELYAFLEVKDPVTSAKQTFKVREGEEFYRPEKIGSQPNNSELLRLVRVIGNQQEVEIEYKPANYVWKIPGPRTRDNVEVHH